MIEEPYPPEDSEKYHAADPVIQHADRIFGEFPTEEKFQKRLHRDGFLGRSYHKGAMLVHGMRSDKPYWVRCYIVERPDGRLDTYRRQSNGNIERSWVSYAADARNLRHDGDRL